MTSEAWAGIVIFGLTQFGALGAMVFVLKGDTKVLREQFGDMKQELKNLAIVVTTLARHEERFNHIEDRQALTGKRLDELSTRLNRFLDMHAIPYLATKRDDD